MNIQIIYILHAYIKLHYSCKHLNIEVHVHVYNDSLPQSPCTPLTKYIYIGYISVGLAVSGLYIVHRNRLSQSRKWLLCPEEVLSHQTALIELPSTLMYHHHKYVGTHRSTYNVKKDLHVPLFPLNSGISGKGGGAYFLINFLSVCFNLHLMMNLLK